MSLQLQITKEYLQQKYIEECNSIRDIAAEADVSYHAVRNLLDKFNIPKRGRHHFAKGRKLSESTKVKLSIARNPNVQQLTEGFLIQRYVKELMTAEEIANLIGCEKTVVTRKLRQFVLIRAGKESLVLRGTIQGEKNHFFGKTHSRETKNKISKSKEGCIGLSGPDNPAWKGGKCSMNQKVRTSRRYKRWRTQCFTRDDYTCQICSERGGRLNVDHIKKFSIILEENQVESYGQAMLCDELWKLENGRTLCLSCHKETDTYGNRKSG